MNARIRIPIILSRRRWRSLSPAARPARRRGPRARGESRAAERSAVGRHRPRAGGPDPRPRPRAHQRRRRARHAVEGAGAAHPPRARRHLPGAPGDGLDRPIPRRHGLSGEQHSRSRRPARGRTAPTRTAAQIAGLLAWYYERDGMRPMLIGHSQGGVQVVQGPLRVRRRASATRSRSGTRTLGDAEPRTTIVDPLTGRDRPVVGLSAVVRLDDRRRRLDAAASQPVEHDGQGVHDSRHRRRIHRVHDGFRFHRLEGHLDERDQRRPARRQAERPQRAPADGLQPPDDAVRRGAPRRFRRRAPGSTPTFPTAPTRRRPRKRSATRSCGQPTSGTASRSTGCSRRSG